MKGRNITSRTSESAAQAIQITWKRSLCASTKPKTTPASVAPICATVAISATTRAVSPAPNRSPAKSISGAVVAARLTPTRIVRTKMTGDRLLRHDGDVADEGERRPAEHDERPARAAGPRACRRSAPRRAGRYSPRGERPGAHRRVAEGLRQIGRQPGEQAVSREHARETDGEQLPEIRPPADARARPRDARPCACGGASGSMIAARRSG